MSNAVFPALRGLTWSRYKTPSFSTKIQTAVSGKETRGANWSYPRWTFKLTYSFLKDDYTVNGDLQQIAGFFLARRGSFDDFLYLDPEDNFVANQRIGTGDGSSTQFQLVRLFGGFVEPVWGVNGTPSIRLGDQSETRFTVSNTGLVTFNTPPVEGTAITADFSFYFRCRFTQDSVEFEEFLRQLWALKTCEFISVKL